MKRYRIVRSIDSDMFRVDRKVLFWWDYVSGTWANTPEESEKKLLKILSGKAKSRIIKEFKL